VSQVALHVQFHDVHISPLRRTGHGGKGAGGDPRTDEGQEGGEREERRIGPGQARRTAHTSPRGARVDATSVFELQRSARRMCVEETEEWIGLLLLLAGRASGAGQGKASALFVV